MGSRILLNVLKKGLQMIGDSNLKELCGKKQKVLHSKAVIMLLKDMTKNHDREHDLIQGTKNGFCKWVIQQMFHCMVQESLTKTIMCAREKVHNSNFRNLLRQIGSVLVSFISQMVLSPQIRN